MITEIEAIDHLTANHLADGCEKKYALFYFLSKAFRQGFLFIKIDKLKIFPDPALFFPQEKEMAQAIQDGFSLIDEKECDSYVKKGTRLYLRRAYTCEQAVVSHLKRIQENTPLEDKRLEKIKEFVAEALSQNRLQQEQAEAIIKGVSQPVFSIYGGPGTGKTYTAGLFLKFFFAAHEDTSLRVALLGPTGKATTNLEKSIRRAFGADFEKIEKQVECKTIHSALGLTRFRTQHVVRSQLPYHLIIVDETSMVDAKLMAEFLSRIHEGTKILFLGDPYQLPPVEPGDLFHDFVVDKRRSHELTVCLRTDQQEIVELAADVKAKDENKVRRWLQRENQVVTFRIIDQANMEKALTSNLEAIFDQFQGDFRLLSPKKDGPWGTEEVNRKLQEIAKRRKIQSTPIMISKNDYQLELMNGEMGTLKNKTAYFASQGLERQIPAILLSQYELAYCLSVHKSQGSEFDKVILLLPPGAEVFGSRMLYTAITRARTSLEIWTSPEVLTATVLQ